MLYNLQNDLFSRQVFKLLHVFGAEFKCRLWTPKPLTAVYVCASVILFMCLCVPTRLLNSWAQIESQCCHSLYLPNDSLTAEICLDTQLVFKQLVTTSLTAAKIIRRESVDEWRKYCRMVICLNHGREGYLWSLWSCKRVLKDSMFVSFRKYLITVEGSVHFHSLQERHSSKPSYYTVMRTQSMNYWDAPRALCLGEAFLFNGDPITRSDNSRVISYLGPHCCWKLDVPTRKQIVLLPDWEVTPPSHLTVEQCPGEHMS